MEWLWQGIVLLAIGSAAGWAYEIFKKKGRAFALSMLRGLFVALVVSTCCAQLYHVLAGPEVMHWWSSPDVLRGWLDRFGIAQTKIENDATIYTIQAKGGSGSPLYLGRPKHDDHALEISISLDLYPTDREWLQSIPPCERALLALHLRDRAAQSNAHFWGLEEPFTSAGFEKLYPFGRGIDMYTVIHGFNEMDSLATLAKDLVAEDRIAWTEHPIAAQCNSAEVHKGNDR